MSDKAEKDDKYRYEPGALVKFFAPKNCENIDAADNLYDLVDLTNGAAYHTMELTGYSDEEIEAYKAQQEAAADEGRKELMDRVKKDCRISATVNGVSDVLSVASGLMTIGGMASKVAASSGKQLFSEALKDTAKAGGIKGTAAKVGRKVFQAGEAQVSAAGRAFSKAGEMGKKGIFGKVGMVLDGKPILETTGKMATNSIGRFRRLANLTGATLATATGAGVVLAPAVVPQVASKMYTEGRAEKLNKEILEATEAQQAIYDYIVNENEKIPEALQEDYDKWAEAYANGQKDLLEAYNQGKITKAEYDEQYEAFIQASQENLDSMSDAHKELGAYIIGEGSANAASEYMITHGVDPVQIEGANQYIKDLDEKHPEAAERAKSAYEARQKMDTGSTFTNFLANMNAALVHYLPGVAYVEAAIVKGMDVVLDFVANKVPIASSIFSYEEKHMGTSVSDMAAQICDSAEARYELNQEVKQAEKAASQGKEATAQASAADEAIEAQAGAVPCASPT